jgi:hypothetical protein
LSAYYYAVAALPALSYTEQPAMEHEVFLDFLEDQLSPGDYALLEAVRYGDTEPMTGDKPVLKAWKRWERTLRNELVRYRASRRRKDPEDYFREGEETLGPVRTAKEVFDAENPLEGEERLDKSRWMYLEELETGHYFDLERVIIYSLKLQLLERRALRTREEGIAKFSDILEKVESQNA